jgi:hypothetical protein
MQHTMDDDRLTGILAAWRRQMVLLLVILILLLVFGAGFVGFIIKSALVAILLAILATAVLGYLVFGNARRS